MPCGTLTGESLVDGLSVLTTQRVKKTKKNLKVMVISFDSILNSRHKYVMVLIARFGAVSVCSLIGLGTGAPIIESPYGESIQPQEAPESISRAVASLPPEQMFELMKQMKVSCFTASAFFFFFYQPIFQLL